MKKMLCTILPLLLLFTACGETASGRVERLQADYAGLTGYETDVRTAIVRDDETLFYTLHLTAARETVRAEVVKPEELAGISAEMTGETLALQYDGMLLDAFSLSPRVSALSCAPLLLKGFREAYLESCGSETICDTEALRADFSVTIDEENFSCTLYIDENGAPLYGEIAQEGKIIAAAEFTNFKFDGILPSDT